MFRWLIFVLLFALSAQSVLAAAATYCGHETAPAAFHIGHHAHEHRDKRDGASVDAAQAMPDQPGGPAHGDCSGCHAHAAQVGAEGERAVGGVPPRSFASAPTPFFASMIDQDIDRPKWARAS
jgi:hypothetical protein